MRTPSAATAAAFAGVRADDLAAVPMAALMAHHPISIPPRSMTCYRLRQTEPVKTDRNVARVAGFLAGLPESVGGVTLNRLCSSGLDAVGTPARAIKAGEQHLLIAGGVESVRAVHLL